MKPRYAYEQVTIREPVGGRCHTERRITRDGQVIETDDVLVDIANMLVDLTRSMLGKDGP